MMDLRLFFLLLMLLPMVAQGQVTQVRIEKEDSRIDEQNAAGYQFAVVASESEVRTSVVKYLKTLGRAKTAGDYITVSEPFIGGKKYAETLYATTRQVGNTSAAWFGMLSPSGEVIDAGNDLEKLAYDFGVTFHREMIQQQIDESTRALQAVEKQQNRLSNQHKDLNNKIESNQRQKIQLEESLAKNKTELETLKNNLASNVKAQDSLSTALEQIRKVVEMHQARQEQVK